MVQRDEAGGRIRTIIGVDDKKVVRQVRRRLGDRLRMTPGLAVSFRPEAEGRSGEIWPRRRNTPDSPPDVSTPLRFARQDKVRVDRALNI